jgi:hypothetical protein
MLFQARAIVLGRIPKSAIFNKTSKLIYLNILYIKQEEGAYILVYM